MFLKTDISIKKLVVPALLLILTACRGTDPSGAVTAPATPATEIISLEPSSRTHWQIYQVNPKLYGSSGAFGKIRARLDDIRALGTDILYLMPVYPEGRTKAIGSPYCIRDFRAVNPAYGTLDELKSLVDEAHAKGMKVLFDWVANHTAWDHPWITEHSDWYEKNAQGEIVWPTRDGAWTDVAQLNYANKELWTAMTDALSYWVRELGIDGYRCDYAHGVRDDYWKDAIARLRTIRPDLVMLAESDYTRMFSDGFDIIFDRAMKSHVRNLWDGKTSPAEFMAWYKGDLAGTPAGKTRLFFITNHDDATEASPVSQFRSKEGALAAYVLMAALNGSAMVYGSQETAYARTINFFTTQTIDWKSDTDYTARYGKALQALSRISRAGRMTAYAAGKVLYIHYAAAGGGKGCLIAVNTAGTAASAALPKALSGQSARELPEGTSETLPEDLSMAAYGWRIWEIL